VIGGRSLDSTSSRRSYVTPLSDQTPVVIFGEPFDFWEGFTKLTNFFCTSFGETNWLDLAQPIKDPSSAFPMLKRA
jgi:hypothetical protein